MDLITRLHVIIAEVRREFAADPRVAVYEIGVAGDERSVTVAGAVSVPAAIEALHRRLALLSADVQIRDEIVRLPDPADADRGHALVTSTIAPLLSAPTVSAAHVSQAVLGHHFVILRQLGRWLNVRAEDGYLGWVHRGYVHRVQEVEARSWLLGARAEVHLSLGGEVLDEDGEVLARLPWGARIQADGESAILPGGTQGRLVGDAVPASRQRDMFPPSGEAINSTAARWLGVPYVWSGVTQAGVDCSGFVQAIYRLHGAELPRDSDQQALAGEPVSVRSDFSGLLPGDLLFFAEDIGRVTHVAISLGGSRIIHSALGNGGVRRNDLNGDSGFEEELRRLLVCARRVLPTGD